MIEETQSIVLSVNETLISRYVDAQIFDIKMTLALGFIGLIGTLLLYLFLFSPNFRSILTITQAKLLMRKLSRKTGRSIIVMSHNNSGFFPSYLNMEDVFEVERFIKKANKKGKDILLIINTYGGELYSGLRLAKILKQNPNITVVVPKFAWSAGTLVCLGANEVLCKQTTIFGAVDPQLSTLFKGFSARDWQRIVRTKGNKSGDDTIGMSIISKNLLKEVQGYLKDITSGTSINFNKANKLLLQHENTHGHILKPEQLKAIGVPLRYIDTQIVDSIIESIPQNKSGVWGTI